MRAAAPGVVIHEVLHVLALCVCDADEGRGREAEQVRHRVHARGRRFFRDGGQVRAVVVFVFFLHSDS